MKEGEWSTRFTKKTIAAGPAHRGEHARPTANGGKSGACGSAAGAISSCVEAFDGTGTFAGVSRRTRYAHAYIVGNTISVSSVATVGRP